MTKKTVFFSAFFLLLMAGGFSVWWGRAAGGGTKDTLDLAVKYLSENNYEQAILAFNEVIEIESKNVKAYQGLAKTYTLQGSFMEAETVYNAGLASVDSSQKWALSLALAGLYVDKGQLSKAENTYKEIIDQSHDSGQAYQGLAIVYEQQGYNDKAREVLMQYANNNPADYMAYNALAEYYYRRGDRDKVVEYTLKSLDCDVNQQKAYSILAEVFGGKWDELINRPGGAGSRNGAMLNLFAYYSSRQYSQAISIFKQSFESDQSNLKARAIAAICCNANADNARADQIIKGLTQGSIPEWVAADIALYYFQAGQNELALNWAERAMDLNPLDCQTLKLISDLGMMSGKNDVSRLYMAILLISDPAPVQQTVMDLNKKGIDIPDFIVKPQQTAYSGKSIGESAGEGKLNPSLEDLTPIRKDGLWGYKNSQGSIVIPCQFEHGSIFSEDLAAVKVGKLYGFIDKTGQLVVAPRFEDVTEFREGLAAVSQSGWHYGFIDRSGQMVIPANYIYAHSFSENGLAAVQIRKADNKLAYGYINRSGQFKLQPRFDGAGWFNEGLASIVIDDKLGYIDSKGSIVIAPQYDPVVLNYFSEGMVTVSLQGKIGYINRSGEMVVPPKFNEGKPFRYGMAAVELEGKWGYIDRTGKIVVKPQYDEANSFIVADQASVQLGTQVIVIDRNGNTLK